MNFLIACDLEGIHGVVGEPYKTLNQTPDYEKAKANAAREINTAAAALFDSGADKVYLWDNHGGGGNLDTSLLDKRIICVTHKDDRYRYDLVKGKDISGVIFLGYHAMEGTPNGVLAHTFSSVGIQYVKLNGKAIGELYTDTRICAYHGIKPLFHAGDDISVAEVKTICPFIETVVTKYGKGRNRAELRDAEAVLAEIYEGVKKAVSVLNEPYGCDHPEKMHLEIRYTRAERSEEIIERASAEGVTATYGEDTHILHFDIDRINLIPKFL